MQDDQLDFRQLDLSGLKTLISWAEQEGWNPGPYDAEVFYLTDPEGYYGVFRDDTMVGGGSIVSYAGDFGFMGFFIVRPEFRSQGIGTALWYRRRDTLLSRLKPGAAIGMDGVLAMQPFYQKGGFEIAFRDERHQRVGESLPTSPMVTQLKEGDLLAVLAYDTQCFGLSRPQFLIPWLSQPDSQGFIYVENGTLRGYAFIRKAHQGYKICPLFADNREVASALYAACLNTCPGELLLIDMPMSNPDGVAMLREYGTTYVFECARMYYGSPPALPVHQIFGITTFELG